MAYAAGIQGWIYSSGKCYEHPRVCAASKNGSIPNNVKIGYQSPVCFLEGLSEVFASPAWYEYTFTKAPKSMISIIQAVYMPELFFLSAGFTVNSTQALYCSGHHMY